MENCIKEKYTINSKEYTLDKDGKSYIIIIKQSDYRIIITSRQYQLMIDDLQEFYKTNGYLFKSFNDLYKFIIDLFDKNRAYI